jgi:hypothetical protein
MTTQKCHAFVESERFVTTLFKKKVPHLTASSTTQIQVAIVWVVMR